MSWSAETLYQPTPTPILFVAPCQNVRGQVPLFPLFLNGNVTPTIPFLYRQHQRTKFPHGITDSSNATGRKGSNVYEVNLWLWQFGRGKPRLGGLSVADTEDSQTELLKDCAVHQQQGRLYVHIVFSYQQRISSAPREHRPP